MKTRKTTTKFSNRVRFNWGYHDAAQAVREGWACPERNFGFGPALKVTCVADVLKQHPDKQYAQGWQFGIQDAEDGMYEVRGRDSTEAWNSAVRMGLVNVEG